MYLAFALNRVPLCGSRKYPYPHGRQLLKIPRVAASGHFLPNSAIGTTHVGMSSVSPATTG